MKQIRSIVLKGKLQSLSFAMVSLAVLALAGCSETSPAFGKFFSGRTLVISVVGIERVPELRYTATTENETPTYVRLTPSQEGLELVVVRLKVQNHTATSAILDINSQAAELRDMLSNKYFPIDVGAVGELVDSPPERGGLSERVLELEADGTFTPTKGFIRGPVELQRGMGLDGWMIFEAPPETEFREFKWRAGDNLTIPFF